MPSLFNLQTQYSCHFPLANAYRRLQIGLVGVLCDEPLPFVKDLPHPDHKHARALLLWLCYSLINILQRRSPCIFQKARLARIRIVKNASGQALYSKKKAHEARMQAFEQGLLSFESLKDEDIFEIQHRHLLQCLEKATVIIPLHLNVLQIKFSGKKSSSHSFDIALSFQIGS